MDGRLHHRRRAPAELLLRGANVLDPRAQLDEPRDILIRDGHIWLTDAPGWGADIDERVLRLHPWPRPGAGDTGLFYGMDPGQMTARPE